MYNRYIIIQTIMTKKEKEYLDGWKRCKADFDNFKKQAEKEMKESENIGKKKVLEKVLPVIDGLGMVIKGLENSLGLKEIDYNKFNPEIHEAISGSGDKIDIILEKGYKLDNKLIRPARVKLKK